MKTLCKQNRQHRYTPYKYKKEYLEYTSNRPVSTKISKPCLFSYCQACSILKAIELNGRKKLSKKCIAQLAVFVSRAWEENPSQETIHQVYYMINNILDTTSMDVNQPFEIALQDYCASTVSTPTICSSITLLVAISYIERLNKRYKELKGTSGCSFRMIMVAFIMASKYIHDSLQLIIYTNSRNKSTPPALSKKIFLSSQTQSIECLLDRLQPIKNAYPSNSGNDTILSKKDDTTPDMTAKERNVRIARMELEFLHFLHYDLSVQDPIMLVKWAQAYDTPEEPPPEPDCTTSGYEADGEMDDNDDT